MELVTLIGRRVTVCCGIALLTACLLASPAQPLCFGTALNQNTMKVEFYSQFSKDVNGEGRWLLSANLSWQRPNTDAAPSLYAVRAMRGQSTGNLRVTNCTLAGLLQTENEFYMFTELSYGYRYLFGVSIVDEKRMVRKSREANIQEVSPDCYLATGNRDFCSTQSVQISGVPIDLQLDCAIAGSHADGEGTGEYAVVLSWSNPIQVSGEVTAYELRYGMSGHRLESFDSAPLITTKKNTSVYIEQLQGLKEMSNYTATVRAFVDGHGGPKAFLHFNTYGERLNNYSHPTDDICQKMEDHPEDSTISYVMVTEYAPSTVGLTVGPLAFLVFVGVVVIACGIKRRKAVAKAKDAIFLRYPEDSRGRKGLYSISKETAENERAMEDQREPEADFLAREVDRSLLAISEKLGNGQFGIVYKATLSPREGLNKKYTPRPVAVKSLKLNATREMKEDFLEEIKLIIDIGNHVNILPILGCCTMDEPYYLIMEFMKHGDLLGFLWKCRDENFQAEDPIYRMAEVGQLQIARQIARGMEYLSSTRYYHGDLAARNVLVGEGLTVKISDFGMADDIYQRGYKRLSQEKKRPLKWVSLETNMKGRCSIKSDVWSFGIVLYEIYTLGDVPYPGMDGFEVVRQLENGYRMEQPDCCPDEIYITMLECWHEKPDLRPSFTALFDKLDRLLSEQSSDYFIGLEADSDQFSLATESTTYCYDGGASGSGVGGGAPAFGPGPGLGRSHSHSLGSAEEGEGARYDSLKAMGWSPVPVVTVECVDNSLQMEKNS